MKDLAKVYNEVLDERRAQDEKWGPDHDDAHEFVHFCHFITRYATYATLEARDGEIAYARYRFIQAAALAVAAVESIDRRFPGLEKITGESS